MNLANNKNPNFFYEKRTGVIIFVVFFVVLGLWAFFAPIESATIATGKVTVADKRKIIQHLEGGIIQAIMVKEDSQVHANQPLILLQDTQAKASLQITQNEIYQSLATIARIHTELQANPTITFPPQLLAVQDQTEVQNTIAMQNAILNSNLKTLQGAIQIYEQRILQLQQETAGIEAQIKANTAQLALIQEELKDVRVLAEKRLVVQSRLLSLEREAASLQGQRGESVATLARLQQKIGETKLEINSIIDKQQKELLTELQTTDKRLAELEEKQSAQQDILNRTIIRSPIAGQVVGLKVNTIGGVIKPGEVLMDIVPLNEALIIEAKINPLDIDVVHPGLIAKVRLSVFKQRTTPLLIGKVTAVSADSFQDETTGQFYYLAKITISTQELKKLPESLQPGMPAEVMIITSKLTPWEYFIDPIKQSFRRAFKEQ
ncbi:MAG: hypothetical protein A3E87_02825 [Gammaproteobacteria bacterium RIFCSPHIGHO2_12_FULL_35_23]|nr:MAG: hypothetical protein A3E87_02825 [Gammaproteobacteria bacterium RIFCSPHIGHO2_12_FULL_35_23]